jgi:hypothetical protein
MRTDFTLTMDSGQVWFVYLPILIPDHSYIHPCLILCLKFKSIVESLITFQYTGFIIYRPITTAMAHFAWSIAVKRLASCINIFTNENVCLTIAELTTIKNTDFHHFAHLLSWNQKSPPPKRRASEWVAVRMATG